MQKILFSFREFLSQISKRCGYILVITMLAGQIPIIAADNVIVTSEQQQITITGTVTDEQGETLPGVNVVIKGTNIGVVTNMDGVFNITVPNEDAVLAFSFVGYTSREIKVGNQRIMSVVMNEDTRQIEEVVVTGYGTQRKSTLTGSISSVSNQELTVTKNENVVNMLSGKMPGLRITQRNAQPGQYNTVIDIRGYGDPYFVIDGVPRDKDYFSRMDPEEIETISILKDAAASVFGLRAANGVMLVTTKSGTAQEGKVDFTYSGNYTWQQMIYVPHGVRTDQWWTLRNEQIWQDFNNNYSQRQEAWKSQEDFNAYNSGAIKDYDWVDKVFRNFTPQTQHNLSINGGNENLRYFISLGYSRQDGSYSSGSLWSERWNFRTNMDAKITKRLSTRVSIGAILVNTNEPNGGLWDVYKTTWLMRPDASFYANDNSQFLNGDPEYIEQANNPLAKTNSDYVGYRIDKTRRLNGSLTLTYQIPGVKGLSAKAMYDYGLSLPDVTAYSKTHTLYMYNKTSDSYDPIPAGSKSSIMRQAKFENATDMQLGFVYTNRFGEHSVNGTLLFEEHYLNYDAFSAQRDLTVNSEYLFAGDPDLQEGKGESPWERVNQAFIGQFNYDYASKYMVDFRFRYDGSSRWPKDSRWGFFPSVSLGWRLSEEGFIKNNTDFISNLKLRASYGEMGDDAAAKNYPPVYTGFSVGSDMRGWIYDGVLMQGVDPTAIPNPALTWYKVTMQNVAIDFDFFKSKLSGSFELFKRDRTGILAERGTQVPGTVGASLPQENMNAERNFGWELELAHHNRIGDVTYFVSGQISATRRKRTKWYEEPASNSYDHWRNRTNGRYDNIFWDREAGYQFTNLTDIRNFQTYPMGQGTLPGDWNFVDWNGDGIINDSDNHPVATRGLPFFNFGLSMGAGYNLNGHIFDFTMNFQGAYKVYVKYSEVFAEPLPFGGQRGLTWFLDRWHPADPSADFFSPDTQWVSGYYPVTGHGNHNDGTNGIKDASYVRLKTLELGYTLPKEWMSRINIKNLRVYISGYNLLTFAPGLKDVDPERPGSQSGLGAEQSGAVGMYQYPNNKTYTVGLSVKF